MTSVVRLREKGDDLRYEIYAQVVFTNGCFDVFHPGHFHLLTKCAQRASDTRSILVVGVNSDESVRQLKGESRPIFGEEHRAGLIAALRFVDLVVIFDELTPLRLIKLIEPRLIVKGGDYREEDVISCGSPVEIIPSLERYSTTKVIESMRCDP